MISKQSHVFVSTNNYEYKNIPVSTLEKKAWSYFVLSMHTGFNQYDFVPVQNIVKGEDDRQLLDLTFRNSVDKEYNIVCTPDQKFFTKNRGYVAASKIKSVDLIFDECGRYCRLVECKPVSENTEAHELFNLEVNYNNCFICNGILVRGA